MQPPPLLRQTQPSYWPTCLIILGYVLVALFGMSLA